MALSAAANVFAVVSVVDVAYRCGTELYEFFSKVQNASASARKLLLILQNLVSILAQVRSFLVDIFDSSPSVDNRAITTLNSILKQCEADLNQLQIQAVKVKAANNSQGWFNKMARSWALHEREILQMTQRLEAHKTNLIASLAVLGRYNDIQIQKELRSVRGSIQQVQKKSHHAAKRTRHEVIKSRALQRDQSSTIIRRISEAESTLSKQFADLTLTENNDDTTLLEGANLESVIAPLIFMKSSLVQVIRVLVASGRMNISSSEARWIKRELENLLARCHLVSAREAERRSKAEGFVGEDDDARCGMAEVEIGSSIESKPQQRYWQGSPVGTLLLEWAQSFDTRQKENSVPDVFSMQFTFIPNPLITETGLAFWLQIETAHQNSIYRRLRVFKTIRSDSTVLQQVSRNDANGLRQLILSRQISPHDRDQNGRSLLFHAVSFGSVDVAQLLMAEGADPLDLTLSLSQPSFTEILWRSWLASFHRQLHANSHPADARLALKEAIDKYRTTTCLAIKKGAETCLTSRRGNILHIFCGSHQGISEQHWEAIVPFTIEVGCDIEAVDDLGNTPLRKALRQPEKDWDLIGILARSSHSRLQEIPWQASLVHLCLQGGRSVLSHSSDEVIRKCRQMEDVLDVLVQRGSDPNHLDDDLRSPLDTILSKRKLCKIWEAILQRNDLYIMEISGGEQSQYNWHKTYIEDSWPLDFDEDNSHPYMCTFDWRFLVVLHSRQILHLLGVIHQNQLRNTSRYDSITRTRENFLHLQAMQPPHVTFPEFTTTFEILQGFFAQTRLPNSGMNLGQWLKESRHYFRIVKSALVRSLLAPEPPVFDPVVLMTVGEAKPFESQNAFITLRSELGDAKLGF